MDDSNVIHFLVIQKWRDVFKISHFLFCSSDGYSRGNDVACLAYCLRKIAFWGDFCYDAIIVVEIYEA